MGEDEDEYGELDGDVYWAPGVSGGMFKLPAPSTELAGGLDLYAPRDLRIEPFGHVSAISLNLVCSMPPGYRARLQARSGLARRHGLVVLGGLIDADYPDEWVLLVTQLGPEPLQIPAGKAVVQACFEHIPRLAHHARSGDEVRAMVLRRGSSRRGGFGSTDAPSGPTPDDQYEEALDRATGLVLSGVAPREAVVACGLVDEDGPDE